VKGEAAAAAAEEPRGRCGRRSDGGLSTLGYLGDFARGPVLFTLYRLGPDQGRYPNGPCEYLIDCDDGVGPHEVCRFTVDADEPTVGSARRAEGANEDRSEVGRRDAVGPKTEGFQATWRGSWNCDPWCPWLLERAAALLAEPKRS
jgi:hypothetical protein